MMIPLFVMLWIADQACLIFSSPHFSCVWLSNASVNIILLYFIHSSWRVYDVHIYILHGSFVLHLSLKQNKNCCGLWVFFRFVSIFLSFLSFRSVYHWFAWFFGYSTLCSTLMLFLYVSISFLSIIALDHFFIHFKHSRFLQSSTNKQQHHNNQQHQMAARALSGSNGFSIRV